MSVIVQQPLKHQLVAPSIVTADLAKFEVSVFVCTSKHMKERVSVCCSFQCNSMLPCWHWTCLEALTTDFQDQGSS